MTTVARTLYNNAIYHVYNRGHNHMTLFHDDSDFLFYLNRIKSSKKNIGFDIYSLCLMTNHYHLLIKDVGKNLSLIMDTINSVYAKYYNEKYKHKGSVFDGPYKSNLVIDDYGFTKVYRYIIRNPIAAGMTDSIYKYPWVTPTKDRDIFRLINFKLVDEKFQKVCNVSYENYLKSEVDDLWVDDIEIYRLDESTAKELFYNILNRIVAKAEFCAKSIDDDKQRVIIQLACFRGVTVKQLVELTGLSIKTIRRLKITQGVICP